MSEIKPLTPDERRIYVEALEREGLIISAKPVRDHETVRIPKTGSPKSVKIAVVSDTHFTSRFQQLSALRSFYKRADEWGAEAFLHGGDVDDGSHKMHRDHLFQNFVHAFDSKLEYAVAHYPKSANGKKTYFIGGNHDRSYEDDQGVSFGDHLARQRDDLVHLGMHSAFVEVGGIRAFVIHGTRGGLSYARSYKPQKLAEQLDPKERERTHLMLIGHYHVGLLLPRYQGMDIALLPAFQSQTPWMRTMSLAPVIGGLLLEITIDGGERRTKAEFVTYDPKADDY